MKYYKEENLKVRFIGPILNKINFIIDDNIKDFYNEKLTYKNENFIFNGEVDFVVANTDGLFNSEKPYFFIQEFKQEKGSSEPEYQLLAELIAGVELNNQKFMKGAYIKGINWHFLILERLKKHKYQYFVSQQFDSTRIDDLTAIYKNLLFVKQEIIEMIKNGE